jgi:hypothetical protein
MPQISLPAFIAFLVSALATALILAPRKEVQSRVFMLFRALFPSWRFFDRTGEVPRLSFRRIASDGAPGPWEEAIPLPPRPLHALVFNPEGNLAFACHTLVGQLVADLQCIPDERPEELTQTASYRLVRNLVEQRIRRQNGALESQPLRYQFRLTAFRVQPDGTPTPEEEFLLSQIESLSPGRSGNWAGNRGQTPPGVLK